MKKIYLSLVFALLFIAARAQSWQTVYSNSTLYYDSGLNAIKIISKQVAPNGDSIFRSYPNLLKPLQFGGNSYAKWDSVSWIGNKIIIRQNGYNGLLNDNNDTCWINTSAMPGQAWDFIIADSVHIEAIVDSVGQYNMHGIADSVKYIRILAVNATLADSNYYKYYNGKQFWLSKHHGIIKTFLISARKDYSAFTGLFPHTFKPEYTQTTLNYFTPRYFDNYSIGDVVQSSFTSNFFYNGQKSALVTITKYTGKRYTPNMDSAIYTLLKRNIAEHRNVVNNQLISRADSSWTDSVVVTNFDVPTFKTMPQEMGVAIVNFGYVGFGKCFTNFSFNRAGSCILPEIHQKYAGDVVGGEFRQPFDQEYSMAYLALGGLEYDYLDGSSGNPGGSWMRRDIVYVKNTCGESGTDVTLSVKETETQNIISVYPNPAGNFLTILAQDIKAIEITDMQGKAMQYAPLALYSNNWLLDVSGLSNGVYFIRVTSEQGTSAQKFIVQR